MKAYYNQEKISSSLRKFFKKIYFLSKPLLKNISYIITGMISAESVVTSDISKKLSILFLFLPLCVLLLFGLLLLVLTMLKTSTNIILKFVILENILITLPLDFTLFLTLVLLFLTDVITTPLIFL